MKVSRIVLFAAAGIVLTALFSCKTRSVVRDGDVVTLFDGSSVAGWRQAGPGEFQLDRGELVAKGGMGLFWYADRSFRDFTLSLEWKVDDADDNSGIFVRFPDPGDDPWVAVNEGYELQICDTAAPKHNTGSVYSFQAPTHVPTKPVGQWNKTVIDVDGGEMKVSINGSVVSTVTECELTEGPIGFQSEGKEIHWRNIRIRER